jgi:hypothetical protein
MYAIGVIPLYYYMLNLLWVGVASSGIAMFLLFLYNYKPAPPKKKTLSPSDMLDIQKKMAVGDAKGAVMLALSRAYNLSEEDIVRIGPDQVRKLMDNLGRQ